LRNHRLAESGSAFEQNVLATVDELELDEALDDRAIDLLRVRPIEAVNGLERAEAREPRTTRKIYRNARPLLEIGELLERLRRANSALVDVRQKRGECVAADTSTPNDVVNDT
jgi:hypothetical protein